MADLRSALQRFRSLVLADPVLQHELRHTPDRASFIALVVERAREHGCAVAAAEVELALVAAGRDWMLRRIR
jgi:uncharacterized membrane protein